MIKIMNLKTRNDEKMNKNNVEKSYGVALSEKQLKFLVNCIDIAQEIELIKPDKEETDIIRRLSRKADQLIDESYDESNLYDLN